jgi:hypothetical protein
MPNRWGRNDDREWSPYDRERGWSERDLVYGPRWHGRSMAERAMGDRGAYEGDHRQPYEPERWGGTYAPEQYERDRFPDRSDIDRYQMDRYRMDRMRGYRERPTGRAPRGYVRSDERIKEDLCDRLMHSWIDAEDVDIQVRSGEVTLAGTVEDRASKRAIEDFADEILGVKDVHNQIRVRPRELERGERDERGERGERSDRAPMPPTGKKPSA